MNVFENLRNGQHYHVFNDKDYVEQAHGEFIRNDKTNKIFSSSGKISKLHESR